MDMQMRHTFTRVGATIDHHAVATRQLQFFRHVARDRFEFEPLRGNRIPKWITYSGPSDSNARTTGKVIE